VVIDYQPPTKQGSGSPGFIFISTGPLWASVGFYDPIHFSFENLSPRLSINN